jgi:hypothetical protein
MRVARADEPICPAQPAGTTGRGADPVVAMTGLAMLLTLAD